MKLSRQHLLLGVLALVGVVRVGDWVLTSLIQGPIDERKTRAADLNGEITKLNNVLREGRSAGQEIEAWQQRSLPAETETARTAYRSWLMSQVEAAKLQSATVDSGSPVSRGGGTRAMPFTVRARGTLDQLTRFLFEFSQASQLQRVQSLDLNPAGAGGLFDMALGVEALMVPGTSRSTINVEPIPDQLASTNPAHYNVISRRNFFGVGSGMLDPLRNTFVTAITSSNGEPQVWFTKRLADEVVKLRVGDVLTVDDFQGTIAEILPRDVVIDAAGERWLLSVGENLNERFAVPQER